MNKEKILRGTFFTPFITGLAGEEGTFQASCEMFPISSFGHRICTKLIHPMFDFYKRNAQMHAARSFFNGSKTSMKTVTAEIILFPMFRNYHLSIR